MAGVLVTAFIATLAYGQTAWHTSKTPHFILYHETRALPSGLTIGLENFHSKLRLHLGLFAPRLGKDQINLFIHESEKSYKDSEFRPPSWSKGIAIASKNAVVLYEEKNIEEFFETAAHEMTHLLFGRYFENAKASLPRWLEEGVAMLMEDLVTKDPRAQTWLMSMKNKEAWQPAPLAKFIESSPEQDASAKSAGAWYVQAYSVSRFLFVGKRLKFKVLCDNLRDGDPLDKALQKAYFLGDPYAFEKAWLNWLKQQQSGR